MHRISGYTSGNNHPQLRSEPAKPTGNVDSRESFNRELEESSFSQSNKLPDNNEFWNQLGSYISELCHWSETDKIQEDTPKISAKIELIHMLKEEFSRTIMPKGIKHSLAKLIKTDANFCKRLYVALKHAHKSGELKDANKIVEVLLSHQYLDPMDQLHISKFAIALAEKIKFGNMQFHTDSILQPWTSDDGKVTRFLLNIQKLETVLKDPLFLNTHQYDEFKDLDTRDLAKLSEAREHAISKAKLFGFSQPTQWIFRDVGGLLVHSGWTQYSTRTPTPEIFKGERTLGMASNGKVELRTVHLDFSVLGKISREQIIELMEIVANYSRDFEDCKTDLEVKQKRLQLDLESTKTLNFDEPLRIKIQTAIEQWVNQCRLAIEDMNSRLSS